MPYFKRIVIEASGLADPAPIAYTILVEPVIQHHFRLGNIITVIDAVNGLQQLETFPEAVKQAALADRLVISKTDLCQSAEIAALRLRLQQLNASAPICDAGLDLDVQALIVEDVYADGARSREAGRWLQNADTDHAAPPHEHTAGVSSFCVQFDKPLDWTAFGIWMTMLLNRHGDKVLRIKGLLNVAGLSTPVLINGVQHIVHPPTHLDAWPDQDRRSRIIFILRDLSEAKIKHSLQVFNALANPAPEAITQSASRQTVL